MTVAHEHSVRPSANIPAAHRPQAPRTPPRRYARLTVALRDSGRTAAQMVPSGASNQSDAHGRFRISPSVARGQAQTFRAPPRRRPVVTNVVLSQDLEIVTFVEVLDEPGMRRVPAEQLLGQRARRGVVKRGGRGEIAEVAGYILRRSDDPLGGPGRVHFVESDGPLYELLREGSVPCRDPADQTRPAVQCPSVSMIKSAVSPPLKFCWPVTRLPSRMAKPFHSPDLV